MVAEPVGVNFGALPAGELNVCHHFTPASRLKVLTRSSTEEEDQALNDLVVHGEGGVPFPDLHRRDRSRVDGLDVSVGGEVGPYESSTFRPSSLA